MENTLLKLTDDNYFSQEANRQYMEVSQFKGFLPQYGGCEAKQMAILNETYKQEDSTPLLVGSYVHSHFEGALDKFKEEHPEIFTKTGSLKSQYQQANDMINCLETDESFKSVYTGDKEKIFTFDLFGAPWKIKVDCLNLKDGYFVDLKTTRDFQKVWNEELHRKVSFAEAWGYLVQIAVYKKGIEIATGSKDIDGFIAAVTKQSPPDKAILYFTPEDYEIGFQEVEENIQHVLDVKNGNVAPERCEHCDYCRATKQLDKAVHYTEL
ncbi:PD-(D/E)XK nuclease-like domain-containing protein [Clostridium tyrobutyricum]|uniref:PD-(D/E)XK nuclease-like domain-containing protein n=1 Tax=Clostridium tyrobutyricum TaxID=1519 RepID=UPI001C3DBD07|nr:PD-(D/E)XK nuclease-like domain-containing protein [Clostridium tyrobutyricum]MBV4436704.1 PD-(D/E)XK nuclease-like domain-containing protein [Clostridium tyrobutyricum]